MEEIVFLMRKDRLKLVRLLRHLSLKDNAPNLGSLTGMTAAEEHSVLYGHEGQEVGMPSHQDVGTKTKRIKICFDFLSSIDQNGELLSAFSEDSFDEIKHKRNLVRIN